MPLVRTAAPELLRITAVNDLALNTTLYYAADLSYTALNIGLSSALFGASPNIPVELLTHVTTGILTLLVILAMFFLMYDISHYSYHPVSPVLTLILRLDAEG